jgi:hypothetical protein
MGKGVTRSKLRDSDMLDAEVSISTDIIYPFQIIPLGILPGYQPGFNFSIEVLVAAYMTYVHVPRNQQAQVIDSPC